MCEWVCECVSANYEWVCASVMAMGVCMCDGCVLV
jgi:hypothetical protein